MSSFQKDNISVAYPVDDPSAPSLDIAIYSHPQNTVKDEGGLKEFLYQLDWPVHLQTFFIQELNKAPIRYFVYDDSGSMSCTDGEKFINNETISCSRWSELCETMKFQVQASCIGKIQTHFMFLNGQSYTTNEIINVEQTFQSMGNMTGGGTPLCRTLNKIIDQIRPMEQELYSNGQKVSIMIATDGESSDGDVTIPLSILKNMPVHITLRLCTNEKRIINLWNNIDRNLELSLDVIDGYCSEAAEVYSVNPWLCYGLPIHQIREYGISYVLFDHLDEITLTYEDQSKMYNIRQRSFTKETSFLSDIKNKPTICKYRFYRYCIYSKTRYSSFSKKSQKKR